MKKTYIIPEALTVSLHVTNIIASSPDVTLSTSDTDAIDAGSVGAKVINDKSVWDNEW